MRWQEGLRAAKRQLIRDALVEAGGTHTAAAKLLGVHPNYLHMLLNKLGMRERSEK